MKLRGTFFNEKSYKFLKTTKKERNARKEEKEKTAAAKLQKAFHLSFYPDITLQN